MPTRQVLIVTHGYLHTRPADTPPADVELDLQRLLKDPARVLPQELRDLTGQDDLVRRFVYATAGAPTLTATTAQLVLELTALVPQVVVHVGCAGGKHRAVAIGEGLGLALEQLGITTEVQHLHKDLPRVVRAHA
ncbi:hypothetical protein BBK82_03465 [Lentzea guizhouensis]|uniref:RapZ C-terminal domain-containing protein n=1 Tax=Lentzea guizhouensis TaxID=1586287 RepID=A0A1B2HC27_9PSEU|nr:RNase adapter RapZ [Lentzea guizhouensis]ANZ35274.1 hypothetical protein BBK82_03465 [Lentzea guizhouensis]